MFYPRAEESWYRTPLAKTVCQTTKELYGYSRIIVDAEATLAAFRAQYRKDWGEDIRTDSDAYKDIAYRAHAC